MPPPVFHAEASSVGATSSHALASSLQIPRSSNRLSEFHVTRVIGKGCFSTVYQANRQVTNQLVALKRISLDGLTSQRARVKCLREIQLLQSVDHPNIIKYFDSFIQDAFLYIVLEWAGSGDLKQMLERARSKRARLHERVIWSYFAQICQALEHMHSRRMIHRDIKPANVFVLPNGLVKLGDLGLGRSLSESTIKAYSKVGTPLYMSPEVLQGAGQDFKSDIWSLGCVLYEMAMLRSPFETNGTSLEQLFNNIVKGVYPEVAGIFSDRLRHVVRSMINLNAEARPKIQDAATAALRALELALPPPPAQQLSRGGGENGNVNSSRRVARAALEDNLDSARSIETLSSEVSQLDVEGRSASSCAGEQRAQQHMRQKRDGDGHSEQKSCSAMNLNFATLRSRNDNRGNRHRGAFSDGDADEPRQISARGKASKRVSRESKLEVEDDRVAESSGSVVANQVPTNDNTTREREAMHGTRVSLARRPLKRTCSDGLDILPAMNHRSMHEPQDTSSHTCVREGGDEMDECKGDDDHDDERATSLDVLPAMNHVRMHEPQDTSSHTSVRAREDRMDECKGDDNGDDDEAVTNANYARSVECLEEEECDNESGDESDCDDDDDDDEEEEDEEEEDDMSNNLSGDDYDDDDEDDDVSDDASDDDDDDDEHDDNIPASVAEAAERILSSQSMRTNIA
jgi:serine/threonine protein kinase